VGQTRRARLEVGKYQRRYERTVRELRAKEKQYMERAKICAMEGRVSAARGAHDSYRIARNSADQMERDIELLSQTEMFLQVAQSKKHLEDAQKGLIGAIMATSQALNIGQMTRTTSEMQTGMEDLIARMRAIDGKNSAASTVILSSGASDSFGGGDGSGGGMGGNGAGNGGGRDREPHPEDDFLVFMESLGIQQDEDAADLRMLLPDVPRGFPTPVSTAPRRARPAETVVAGDAAVAAKPARAPAAAPAAARFNPDTVAANLALLSQLTTPPAGTPPPVAAPPPANLVRFPMPGEAAAVAPPGPPPPGPPPPGPPPPGPPPPGPPPPGPPPEFNFTFPGPPPPPPSSSS